MKKINEFFDARKAYGTIFLRLIIGWRLIAGVWQYIIHAKPIAEVQTYFSSLSLPVPDISAWVAVYAEFICAVLFIIGLWMRPAALLMVVNFTIAILAAHLHEGVEKSFAAWAILGVSMFFLFNGAGEISTDNNCQKAKLIYRK